MSEEKKIEQLARKIWLAGLGAYGQGLDNIEQGYEKMNTQTRKLFDDLVVRGEHLENDVKDKGKKLKAKGKKITTKQRNRITSRFNELGNKVNVPEFLNEQINDIRSKLNDVSEAVGKILTSSKTLTGDASSTVKKPGETKPTKARPVAPKKAIARKPTQAKDNFRKTAANTADAEKVSVTSAAPGKSKTTARKTTAKVTTNPPSAPKQAEIASEKVAR